MFKLLFVSSVSACFEFNNKNPYYSPEKYTVTVNGVEDKTERDTNVFSVFNLAPNTKYTVKTSLGGTVNFVTEKESGVVDVKAFGAKGDGATDDTESIQSAIDGCPNGGRVLFPEGTYYTRPLELKSDITIELKKGAQILGDTVEEHYPVLPARTILNGKEEIMASWEGEPFDCFQSLIYAYRQKNIRIVGEGFINGNANNSTWWATPKGRKIARPRLVFLNKCENVVFHGVKAGNSASWNLHPFFSDNLKFYDISVECPADAPNTDGLDPESCNGVDIIGCKFSVGDDCVALKSGKLYMGKTYKTPANNHTLRNNLFCDGHGAIVLGSEMSGGVKNLTLGQCVFQNTDRGLRIKSRRGRGKDGIIDGVCFENIKMLNVKTPLVINMYYFCDPDGMSDFVWSHDKNIPVDDGTPYMGKFTFRDIDCVDCECMPAWFDGLSEMPIKEIRLENVHFSFKPDSKPFFPAMALKVTEHCKEGLYADNVEKLILKNVTIDGVEGEQIICKNIGQLIKE
ncbi:MAG: glycoside hydrolase family 28 protein [Clostridia bacterium]|nr:glycoside hydrolase family 28 protein [Clostridia bacterium]